MRLRSHRTATLIAVIVVSALAAAAATQHGKHSHHSERHAATGLPAPHPETYRQQFTLYGILAAPRLDESSGIIASRIHPGVYWTHNDSGNPPELFAIDEFGRDLGVWKVAGASNIDWEDIATDSSGHLIIGDIGDNHHRRSDQKLYVVDEPRDLHAPGEIPVRQMHPFVFPEKHRNCEALFECDGQYYVIEKLGKADHPSRHAAWLYRVPRGGSTDHPPALKPIEEFDFDGPVTAADITADGKHLAVGTYAAVYVFDRPDPKGRFFVDHPRSVPIACGKMEAVTFHHDGSGDLLMTSEERMMFRFPKTWYRAASPPPFVPGAQLTAASQSARP